MQVSGVLDAQVGFALFDAWLASVEGHRRGRGGCSEVASPLIDAAFKAFDHYVQLAEIGHAAQIAGAGAMLGYAPNAKGTGVAATKDIAPFLALNVMG